MDNVYNIIEYFGNLTAQNDDCHFIINNEYVFKRLEL